MQIDPRRLKFLLAVARTGGVLAAADELHVTPSAVSQQIARLEAETRRSLVTRTPHGTVLTPVGLAVAEAAEEIERTLNLVGARLEQEGAVLRGTARIGGFPSFLSAVIAPELAGWRQRLPGVHCEIVETPQDLRLRALRAGELDLAVVAVDDDAAMKPLPAGVTEVPLLDEPWRLVVPSGTLLAEFVDLTRLSLPWLGVPETAVNAHAMQRLRRAVGASETTVHTCTGTQSALALVAAGEGIALVPSLALGGILQDGIEILDAPGLGTRRIVLRQYTRRDNEAVAAVTGLILEAASQITFEGTHAGAQ
jgi:DNA-binding transcriptional LysR family regulator